MLKIFNLNTGISYSIEHNCPTTNSLAASSTKAESRQCTAAHQLTITAVDD